MLKLQVTSGVMSLRIISQRALGKFSRRGFVISRNVVPLGLLRPFMGPEYKSVFHQPLSKLSPGLAQFLRPLEQTSFRTQLDRAHLTVYKSDSWPSTNHTSATWHQDHPLRGPFITIPLVPWTRANGATQIVAGSHSVKNGKPDLMVRKVGLEEEEACEMFGVPLRVAHEPHPSRIRDACMNMGDILFTDPRVFHRRPAIACKPTTGRHGLFIVFE